jgi:HD-GYP domain-containing protein (c-di-GMP phosphodiesterase class II)
MDVCDPDLNAHASRAGALAEMIARRLGWDQDRIDDLKLGAAIHDVGKIALRQEVLRKPGPLDPGEIAQVRTHPVEGAWLVAGVRSLVPAMPYVLFHHERWDGSGYPTRRSRNEIPVEGRLLAIADAFDAMTSSRPYRKALTLEAALGRSSTPRSPTRSSRPGARERSPRRRRSRSWSRPAERSPTAPCLA